MIEPGLRDPDRLNDGETLIERLVAALELREASDPDSPPWVAEREIRYLEHRILVSARDPEWPAILGMPPQGTAD
jgi:hypothetical protein